MALSSVCRLEYSSSPSCWTHKDVREPLCCLRTRHIKGGQSLRAWKGTLSCLNLLSFSWPPGGDYSCSKKHVSYVTYDLGLVFLGKMKIMLAFTANWTCLCSGLWRCSLLIKPVEFTTSTFYGLKNKKMKKGNIITELLTLLIKIIIPQILSNYDWSGIRRVEPGVTAALSSFLFTSQSGIMFLSRCEASDDQVHSLCLLSTLFCTFLCWSAKSALSEVSRMMLDATILKFPPQSVWTKCDEYSQIFGSHHQEWSAWWWPSAAPTNQQCAVLHFVQLVWGVSRWHMKNMAWTPKVEMFV